MKLATSQQIRAMDRETIEGFGMPSIVLMENSAIRIVDEIARRVSPLAGKRVAVIAGKGNNGGDGFAVARHLATRYFAAVTVWLTEEGDDKSSADYHTNLELTRRFGITVRNIEGWTSFDNELAASDLIVDAILGTGIDGDPRPEAARGITAINNAGRTVISVDIPSGLSSDSGRVGNPTVKATFTVTLGVSKPGLHLFPGAEYAGEILVADICFPAAVRNKPELNTYLTEPSDIAAWLPSRKADRDSNKGRFGSVALLAGSPGFAGAACLTAHGASRVGAGLVTLGVPKSIFEATMTRVVETVMTKPHPDSPTGTFSNSAVKSALVAVEKADACGIGPGMNAADAGLREFVQRFVRECPVPLIIDADALNAIAVLSDKGASLVKARTAATILTPHPGEMGRLLGVATSVVQQDRVGAVRRAAEWFGCVVLLKGERTLIASPDGRLAINATGNPGMASGGMGDLLTGIATTFAAQISDPWQAASAAAYVHGLAGDLAAAQIGTAGLLAPDVADRLPLALRECGV